ncbi:MAG: hypothetical protein LUF30_06795, partial [Lachnospiraceae bacterium]|nr:hypothetical protein [Lachnospiraceae bacterium]
EDESGAEAVGAGAETETGATGIGTEETATASDEESESQSASGEPSGTGSSDAQEESSATGNLETEEEASEAETLNAQDADARAEAEDQASGIVLDIKVETDPEDEPAAIASGAYTVSGTTITVSVTSGADISTNVNAALKAATSMGSATKQITVKVPEGSYKLGSALLIYSYTTLDVTGCTLTSTKTEHNLLQTGDSTYNTSSACAGYGGYTNVTVIGGTWKGNDSNTASLMRFLHATNVTVEGVTLDGGGCTHQMEVAAINGFTVTGCTFQNHGTATYGDAHVNQEALQMDIPVSEDVIKATYQDGTVMKNVTITGNTFSKVYRGVGTHTMLYGAYHENIVISDNTF